MKKRLQVVLGIVILALAGYCLYMETHFTMSTLADTGLSEEKILREMPEIAIREQDFDLEAHVLSLSRVQEMLARTKTEDPDDLKTEFIPLEEAASLLSDWVEEGWKVTELAVLRGNSVSVCFSKEDGTKSIYYAFFIEDSIPMQKTIGVYGRTLFQDDACKAVYQNLNGEITKMKHKHLWFYWLTGEI